MIKHMPAHVGTDFVTFFVKLLCNFSPLHLIISLEQRRSAIGCFSPVVGCELNVNARTCTHDVTNFNSFVPVWLFHYVSGSFTEAVTAKVCNVNHIKQVLFILNMHSCPAE